MKQLSLFDFLGFAIPGSTLILLVSAILPSYDLAYFHMSLNVEEKVIPFFVISYILGHILSIFGKQIEKLIYIDKPWTRYLKMNSNNAKMINERCIEYFKINFINTSSKAIKETESGIAFDKIYCYLESINKLDKIKILMSQYVFFRNMTPVWIILFLVSFMVKSSILTHLPISIILLFLVLVMILFQKERKFLMMKNVYDTFLIASTLKTK